MDDNLEEGRLPATPPSGFPCVRDRSGSRHPDRPERRPAVSGSGRGTRARFSFCEATRGPGDEGGGISEGGIRVNEEIGSDPVRLIDDQGGQVGIVSLEDARSRAAAEGLDLVEVSPGARPPVVKLMDAARLFRVCRQGQEPVQVKEMKLRAGLENHEYEFKIRHARRYLEEGYKVEWTMRFGDRPETSSEAGERVLERIRTDLEDVATVESRPSFEGRTMTMTLAPLKLS